MLRLLASLCLAFACVSAQATTWVSDGSRADVQAKINSASNGDTVTLPSGTFVWNTQVTVGAEGANKSIILSGNGIGSTIVSNTIGSATYVLRLYLSGAVSGDSRMRITGIEFDGNNTGGGIEVMQYGTRNAEYRIDHCKLKNSPVGHGSGLISFGLYAALIDHCTFTDSYASRVFGDPDDNLSWTTASSLGTVNCIVEEDNIYEYTAAYSEPDSITWDTDRGGRRTIRYGTWSTAKNIPFTPMFDCHGNQAIVTGQSPPPADPPGGSDGTDHLRGTRQVEIYHMTYGASVALSNAPYFDLRGGTLIIANNTFDSHFNANPAQMREEDGPDRFNWLSTYPGYDPHIAYFYGNTVNGSATNLYSIGGSSTAFFVTSTNLFTAAPVGYTPLAYPHPWITGTPTPDPSTIASTTPTTTQITVVATLTTGGTGAIEYNHAKNGTYAGWQSSQSHPFTGLTPSTSYAFKVKARDSATPTPNETAESAVSNVSTLSVTPPAAPGTPVITGILP